MKALLVMLVLLMLQQGQPYTITAYCLQGYGASGQYVHDGMVAVDTSIIPMYSRLTIEGLPGTYTALDTGGGVIGNHVDVWMPDCQDAIDWGRRTRLVTINP